VVGSCAPLAALVAANCTRENKVAGSTIRSGAGSAHARQAAPGGLKADRHAESDTARARLYARFAETPDPDAALKAAMARMRLLSLKAAERRKREAAVEAPQPDTS
jgi:hypothetical protein